MSPIRLECYTGSMSSVITRDRLVTENVNFDWNIPRLNSQKKLYLEKPQNKLRITLFTLLLWLYPSGRAICQLNSSQMGAYDPAKECKTNTYIKFKHEILFQLFWSDYYVTIVFRVPYAWKGVRCVLKKQLSVYSTDLWRWWPRKDLLWTSEESEKETIHCDCSSSTSD